MIKGEKYNSHVIDVQIQPDQELNKDLYNFTWKCTSFRETTLQIKINFTNPDLISVNEKKDLLVVVFKNKYFRTIDGQEISSKAASLKS